MKAQTEQLGPALAAVAQDVDRASMTPGSPLSSLHVSQAFTHTLCIRRARAASVHVAIARPVSQTCIFSSMLGTQLCIAAPTFRKPFHVLPFMAPH
jgi:hypothetical protein